MEKKHVLAVLFGLAAFNVISNIITNFRTILEWFNPQIHGVISSDAHAYTMLNRVMIVLAVLTIAAVLVLNLLAAFGKNDKRRKLYACAACGGLVCIFIYMIIMRIAIPTTLNESGRLIWDAAAGSGLYAIFKGSYVIPYLIWGGIMTAIVLIPMICKCRRERKENNQGATQQ